MRLGNLTTTNQVIYELSTRDRSISQFQGSSNWFPEGPVIFDDTGYSTNMASWSYKVVPQCAKSQSWGSHNSNFTMVYGRDIYILTMVYKPTYNWGGHHLVAIEDWAFWDAAWRGSHVFFPGQSYHLVIKDSHGKSLIKFINEGINGKIIYKWAIFHGYVSYLTLW